MKLLQALLESINESKPITLDDSVIPQIEGLYDTYKNMSYEKKNALTKGGRLKLGRINFKSPYDPKFTGADIYIVHVDNTRDFAKYIHAGKYILLNIASPIFDFKKLFTENLYHELVHAIDPKVVDGKLRNNVAKRLEKDVSDEYLKYLKDPAEFDAFSSSYLNSISNAIKELDSEELKKEAKSVIKELIQKLLSIQKKVTPTGTIDDNFMDLHTEELSDIAILLYQKYNIPYYTTNSIIVNMLYYMQKPTLFKKYIQRFSTLL